MGQVDGLSTRRCRQLTLALFTSAGAGMFKDPSFEVKTQVDKRGRKVRRPTGKSTRAAAEPTGRRLRSLSPAACLETTTLPAGEDCPAA